MIAVPEINGTLNIAEGTTTIRNGCFTSSHGSLTEVVIPASVETIQTYALYAMNNFLPSSVTLTVDSENPYWQVNDSGDIEAKTSTLN